MRHVEARRPVLEGDDGRWQAAMRCCLCNPSRRGEDVVIDSCSKIKIFPLLAKFVWRRHFEAKISPISTLTKSQGIPVDFCSKLHLQLLFPCGTQLYPCLFLHHVSELPECLQMLCSNSANGRLQAMLSILISSQSTPNIKTMAIYRGGSSIYESQNPGYRRPNKPIDTAGDCRSGF